MGISTHILDLTKGQPAASVKVTLLIFDAKGHWTDKAAAKTDFEGRCRALTPEDQAVAPGTYRLRFDTGAYFAAQGTQPFFPYVEITFSVTDAAKHYHVPLLLSPFGYSTYRGS
jgi:5-hydroxyisourate hydrolase